LTRSSDAATGSSDARPSLTVRHLYVLIPIAVVAWRAVTPLGDNSFLWHVRAGTLQLDRGEVLSSDPFSFTAAGEPWRTQSWLVELGYGWLERTTGSLQWVPTMMFVVMAATLAFVGLAVYRVVGDPARTALAVAAVAWVGMLFVVPRPVIVSFLLLAAFVVILGHAQRLAWALIPLTWLWASVHGLFVVGLGLVALEALRRRSWRLFAIGTAAGLATLLTAHGIGVIQILIDFFENRDALGLLSEWKRPDFWSRNLFPAVIVGLALAAAFVRRRLDLSHTIVAAPFVLMGALQLRSVFPALIVLAPLAAPALGTGDPGRQRSGGNPRINKAIATTIVLLAVIGLLRPIGRDTGTLPPDAAVAALTTERVFHGPGAGGLLIWSEYPDRRVFVDDRAELFGADAFREFLAARNGETGTALLDAHGLDEALVKTEWRIDSVLQEEGWLETYRDDEWAVFVRP
jgi:hypothetical protein